MKRFKQDCCGKDSSHTYYGIRLGNLRFERWPNQPSFIFHRKPFVFGIGQFVIRFQQARQVMALGGSGLTKPNNYKEW